MPESDSEKIWKLRNHPFIATWMINDNEISFSEHKRFIKNLKQNPNKDYYLIKDFDDNIIGSVNITYTDFGISERGIFINPDNWGKGHAYKCLTEFYNHIKNNHEVKIIRTVVKIDNDASNSLEKKLGSELIGTDNVYNTYILQLM